MNAMTIPNHDASLLAESDCDNSAMDAARESLTEGQQRDIVVSVADRFGGHDAFATLETLADQIKTLAGANTVLSMLFQGMTVEQAFDRCKGNQYLIQSFRTLGRLTAQCAKSLDEATRDKVAELADHEAELSVMDEAEARAA